MKRTYWMVIVVLFLSIIIGVKDDNIDISLFDRNVDVLASSESAIPDDGIMYNYKPMDVWWELSTGKYYAEKPSMQYGTYLKTRCCVNSTDMNCCDFFQVGWECDNVIMR